jgi:hypothetical protein
MNYTYTREDQEFFFNIADQILERFGVLSNVDNDCVCDCIIDYMDMIVNQLELFRRLNQNNLANQNNLVNQ